MASFEPIVVTFGSPTSVATANLRLPVSSLFAFDVKSLEQIVSVSPQLSDPCLHRYFVILLESIDKDLLTRLESNHRVVSVYNQETMCDNTQNQLNQMMNSFRQLTLDLSSDIVRFLTSEGEKQIKLERMHLVKIYYQQARVLKEWIMAFFKAEPCHILLISLNSTQQNLDSAQQRLQQMCTKLGYSSTVIRQFGDYIPSSDRDSSLLPYAKLLFNNEDPKYIRQLIKKLSPIRLYLYGNELCDLSGWSKLMIESETDLMDDEDNWITFIENEFVNNEVKWNFGFMFGREWKISRVSPLDLNQLNDDPRFRSALRRAHITFAERQIEVTADIFDWHANCIERGYLHIQPKLTYQQESIKNRHRPKNAIELVQCCRFQRLFSFDYPNFDSPRVKSISFVWLDEMLNDPNGEFYRIINPLQWDFFDDISRCISFIERQIREQRYIFLIVSGTLGHELFLTTFCLMKQIFATYVYCAHLGPHNTWSRQYSQIRGVYNDHKKLAEHIKRDYNQLLNSLGINKINSYNSSIVKKENKILHQSEDVESLLPLPLTVYNCEEAHLFMAHQRTIDTLLCMPHTSESKLEMIDEFRRIYNDNLVVLGEIDDFQYNYESNAAVYWYTRDSFVCRTINQTLRSSDVDTMFKLRHILTDIYVHLNESYRENHSSFFQSPSEIYYRGQLMSNKEFDYFKELRGNIISINTFLSTTKSMQVALMYAGKYHTNPDMISVVFSIEKDSQAINTRPYANISHYSLFPDEDETLFAMGSVFRIGNIRELTNADNIWVIHLKMTDQQDFGFIKMNSTTS